MEIEDDWLSWAKRLQGLASTGLHFATDSYDIDRYREVGEIAHQMLAAIGSVPIPRIESLVSDFAKGYATPKVDVRGAVFRDDEVLLVQERSDGLWALPGGYADVGRSPAENIVKEIREEASLEVAVRSLYSVRHKARHAYDADARDFYKLFFRCEPVDGSTVHPGGETMDARYFALDELPPLSTGRVIVDDIVMAFESRRRSLGLTWFD